jgi:hypothetical protein
MFGDARRHVLVIVAHTRGPEGFNSDKRWWQAVEMPIF